MTIVDRAIASALYDALGPVLDRRFLAASYGFRPCRSPHQMLAQILYDITSHSRSVIGLDDINDAFPSVQINRLLEQLQLVLAAIASTQNEPTLAAEWFAMLETMVRGAYPDRRDGGLEQGSPLSPLLLNLYLDTVLDQPLHAADPGGTPRYRYADNLGVLCRGYSECRRELHCARDLLSECGMSLKGLEPVNLERPGATAEVLGFRLRLDDGVPRYHLRDDALTDLSDELAETYEADYPGRTAILVVRGWLQAQGPALETTEDDQVIERVYAAAAYSGIRELGPTRDLRAIIQEARERWLGLRRQLLPASRLCPTW